MTTPEKDVVESLLLHAKRRAAPSAEVTAAVYDHAKQVWRSEVRARRTQHACFALAAAFAFASVATWRVWLRSPPQQVAQLAPGEDASIQHEDWRARLSGDKNGIFRGDTLTSLTRGAAVWMADGTELRLAQESKMQFSAAGNLRLQRGKVFIDTHPETGNRALQVITELGRVEHVGTRFLVDIESQQLTVAVRDGKVSLLIEKSEPIALQSGQAAKWSSGGGLQRWDGSGTDPIWDWTDAMEPPLQLEGQLLRDVLSVIALRAGLALRFADAQAEAVARAQTLHGPPLRLPARQALDAVLATSYLSGAAEGPYIVIHSR